MSNDKRTIGVTASNNRVLAELVKAGHFGSELDAAKFAMAVAIKKGVEAGSADGADTKWNVGSADADGLLRSTIQALYPDATEPYRLVEYLMNEGLRLIDPGQNLPPDVVSLLFEAADGPVSAAGQR